MEYNKRQFSKTNNKKVLHKVKKNWVVVSMALLSAIGGGAAITHANAAHADTNAGNQSATSQTQSSAVSGTQLKVSSGATQSSSIAQNSTDPKVITQQANNMYKRVLGNATQQAMHQSSGVINQQNSASVNGRSASANSSRSNVGSNHNLLKLHPDSNGKVSWDQFIQHHNYLVKHNLGAQSHEKLGATGNGRITIVWQVPSDGYHTLKEEPQSDNDGTPFNIKPFLKTVPNGYYNPRVASNHKVPATYNGYQTAYIYVSKIPSDQKCVIKVNYLDMDNSNEEEKHLISSDSDGAPFSYMSDLLPDMITPPDGYTVVNYNTKALKDPLHPANGKYIGDVNPATVPTSFQPGLKQINIEIVPKGAANSGNSDNTTVAGKPVYVNYINQHGVNVNTQSDDQPINGKKGSTVDVTNVNPIPAGYRLAHPEEVNYKIGSDVQNVKVDVAGKPLSTPDTFTIHRATNDGQSFSDATMPINGSVGDSFNVDPNAYVPSGYHVDKNDNGYTGTILANGLSQNSIQYVYDANNANQKSAQPIYVKYYNQNGQIVNTSNDDNPINGTLGANVNVTNNAPVPTGYTLDQKQNTNRTISNNPQNVSLFVTGNKASDTFTIHRNENVIKSDGTSTGKTNKLSDVSDNVQGLVGDNEMVYPSAYMPSGDQMTASDEPVQVTIMPNGKLAPVNNAQFTYNKSANGKALPSNIVNGSIVYEDKDNNNNTVGLPITISGVNGSKVDYDEYDNAIQQNVPSGFYLIKPMDTNATLSSNGKYPYQVGEYGYVKVSFVNEDQNNMDMNSDEIQQPVGSTINVQNIINNYLNKHVGYQLASDNNYTPNVTVASSSYNDPDDVEVKLTKPKAQPITISYINQANDTVVSKQINGNIGDSGDVTKSVPVPNGYNLNPNQNTNYKIGKQAQNLTLHITGQKLPQPIQFVIHQTSSNGQQLPDKDVPINGSIGDHYQVDPAQAQNVPNGYYASNGSQVINGTILPGNKLSTGSTNCTYTKKPVKPVKTIVPVTITYVNQNGDNVNTKSDDAPIKVSAGSFISDIINDAPVPAGYTPNGSDRVAYNVGNQPMKISLKVTGNKLSSHFMIHRSETKVNSDGQPVGKAQQLSDAVVPVQGQVGNKNITTIYPTKYVPQGDKLTAADQPITITLGNDGKLTPSSSTQFSYDKPVVTSLTANIQYEDEFSHKIVGTLTDKGDKNSPINYAAYENKDRLPSGYVFIKLGNHNQNIESNGENDVIMVAKPATGKIVYKDINNNDQSVGSTPVSGYAGQILTDAQYQSKVPAGYEYIGPANNGATLSKGQSYPVLVVEAGKNNSGSLIKANAQIVYEDADNNNAIVKTTPISGLAGSHIDYSGYQHQVPSGYSYAGMGSYNNNLEKNGRNVILVAENGNQHIPSALPNVSANILYEDIDNHNSVVSTQHVNGLKGSQINYRDYTEHVPAGYTLVGMGDYDDNLEDNEDNVIYVAENGKYNQPSTPAKVSAQLVYENVNDNNQAIGSTVDLNGVAGTAINYDTYKSSPYMPAGYHFVGMGHNDSNLESGDIDYMKVAADGSYNSGSNVAPTSMASNNTTPANSYATNDLVYVDNANHVVANQAVTGEVGTPVNYSNYVPAGYVMNGNVTGSPTYQSNGRDYIYVEPVNNQSVASNSAASSTSQSSVASGSTAPASSTPASNSPHTASDETSDNHEDNDDNGRQSIGHRIANGDHNYENNNNNALGIDHSGNRYGGSANALGISSYPNDGAVTAGANEANVGGVNGEASESGSNNGKLPQTGEANSSKKAIAAALLAISATLGTLDAVVRRRLDND